MASLPKFPSIDLSSLDLNRLRSIQWPNIELPGIDAETLTNALRDAAYITIGFGVLAFQQAQVRRRELVTGLSERFDTSTPQMDQLLKSFEASITALDARFDDLEAKLDQTVEKLEARLPEQAGALLGQAHDVAKAARKQVRGLIRSAA